MNQEEVKMHYEEEKKQPKTTFDKIQTIYNIVKLRLPYRMNAYIDALKPEPQNYARRKEDVL